MQTKKYNDSLSYFTVTLALLGAVGLGALPVHAEETPKPQIGDKIRANMETRLEKNKELRNIEMNRRSTSTPAPMAPKMMRPAVMLKASTSVEFKRNHEERQTLSQTMKARAFETRKNNLERQLNVALTNLESIAVRIEAKITKLEGEGKDVVEAKTLFTAAQAVLEQAKLDVSAFEELTISSPAATTTVEGETEVELTKPRVLGDEAIKSVKEARDAMKDVLEALND